MTHPHGVLSSITSEKTVLRTMLIGFSRSVALAVTTLLMFSSTASINAQEVAGAPTNPDAEQAEIADTSDETPDQDKAKKKKTKFPVLPIPIFISEPAIGYGLGIAAGYFHPRGGDEKRAESISPVITTGAPPGTTLDNESKPPPVITGIAAAYTDKGSWGAGIGIR